MKTTITSLCIALGLTLGVSTTALADHGRGRHGGYYGGPPRHHHDGGHHRGSNWAGPAAVLAIAGIAVGATQGYIYLRAEYPHGHQSLLAAIAAAESAAPCLCAMPQPA